MKIKSLRGLLFLILLFSVSIVFGQTITGKVSNDGLPLPGVNVAIKGTTIGAVTDFDGLYTIQDVKENLILVFSSIGFINQEITVTKGKGVINVNLEQDIESLGEVVVVGYGTQSRAKVSSAITSVKSKALNDTPIIGVDQALQGKAAGVVVQSGGSPGQAPTVRVRGLSTFGGGDPLYVVDGIVVTDLNTINPSSIDKVDILKDAASAAIYGSRGSNGVILITTKKGKKGWSKIGLNTYTGFQNFNNKYDLLNAQQYREYASAFGELPRRLTETQFAESVSNTDTDWQDQIFRTAAQSNVDVNYSGGSDKINYYMYGGYLEQEGVIINTGFDRYTFGINSDLEVSDKIKIGETLGIGTTDQAQLNESGGRTLIEHAIKQAPLLNVFEPGTNNFEGPTNSIDLNDAENPVRAQTNQERINKNTNLYGSVYGEYKPLKGLKFRQQVGVNLNYNINSFISRSYEDGDYSSQLLPTESAHRQNFNLFSDARSRFLQTTLTSTLSYDTTIADKHDISATAVFERLDSSRDNLRSTGQVQNILDQFNERGSTATSITLIEEDILVSYIGRLNYTYADKYILSGSIRRDGSSRFGQNFIWGNFPAASAAWRVGEEEFLSNVDAISELKLRASIGVTGNNDIGFYRSQATIGPFGSYIIGTGEALINNNVFNGFTNEDLRWEKSIKTNFGIDLGLFNNKLTFAAEYFTSKGEDLLTDTRPEGSAGIPNTTDNEDFSGVAGNVADVETNGIEFSLGYTDSVGDFKWSADANLSISENEVTDIGDSSDIIIGSTFEQEALNVIRPGDPILSFYGWETDGLFQSTEEITSSATQDAATSLGDIKFVDQITVDTDGDGIADAGDGVINDADRTIIGNPFPDFTYALNLTASYKGFDVLVNLYGVQGIELFNSNLYDIEGSGRLFNAGTTVLDAWTLENKNTSQPRVITGDPNRNVRVSDRYIEDGSYLRVKNFTLGFSIPEKILKTVSSGVLSKLRVYAQAQNAFTFTKYKGYDPEVPARRSDVINNTGPITELGVDRGFYPTPRSFLIGVQAEF